MKNYIILLIFCLSYCFNLIADEIQLNIDNDAFLGTDQWYTHATYIGYKYPRKKNYNQWLLNKPVSHTKIAIGQYIYTPSDISVPTLMENDRPYAGVLFGQYTDYMRINNKLSSLSVCVGTVGEWSQADHSQIIVHKIGDHKTPEGWNNQLNNEPFLNLTYIDRHKLNSKKYFNQIVYWGGSLGNLNTHFCLGSTTMIGWDVPQWNKGDGMEPLPKVTSLFDKLSIYLFATIEGRMVAHNLLLDGNTFSDSHSVDKKYFVGDFVTGLGIRMYNFEVIYSAFFRSREFEGQKHCAKYGSVKIIYNF